MNTIEIIVYMIVGAVFFLLIFNMLMKWRSNRQLKKLQRRYEQDVQNRGDSRSNPVKARPNISLQRESNIERTSSIEGRELLPTASYQPTGDDKPEPSIAESKPRGFFGKFKRRKQVDFEEAL